VSSVNFVTCHDGFTLADLVSYGGKHKEANGEGNRDGSNDNLSWNCGAEGETADAGILSLRRKQAKNFMAVLLLSQGVPMILAGDEVLRTQRGNNNAYCQDNEISWFDWTLVEKNADMFRFTRELIALRKRHPALRRGRFLTGRPDKGASRPDVAWHGRNLGEPLWNDGSARLLAFTLAASEPGEETLHVVMNMSDDGLEAPLPEAEPGEKFHVAVDTAAASPADVRPRAAQAPLSGRTFRVEPRSVVVLEGRRAGRRASS
jgi:glycogen operon protein